VEELRLFREYSAVTHVAKGKGIPPFLHVAIIRTPLPRRSVWHRVWEKSHRDDMLIAQGHPLERAPAQSLSLCIPMPANRKISVY
jgi:hypothetical protein